jgi:cold shock CspA family protein
MDESTRMQGKMLWFNAEKGFGFIETEHEERLYVASSGFVPDSLPNGRCAGRNVVFERQVREGDTRAVGVSFTADDEPRRARARHSHGPRSH